MGEFMRRTAAVQALRIRVGINSGEVRAALDYYSNHVHMDYTAVGQSTHLSARMEQHAEPGSTLLTGSTLQLGEGYIAVKTHRPVQVNALLCWRRQKRHFIGMAWRAARCGNKDTGQRTSNRKYHGRKWTWPAAVSTQCRIRRRCCRERRVHPRSKRSCRVIDFRL